MIRRTFLTGSLALAILPAMAAEPLAKMTVVKSPACGCCGAWIDHIRAAGFNISVQDVDQERLYQVKEQLGLASEHWSCHTAFVGRYFVEGHVPATDVMRLLSEQPDILGLSVPGMPIGSPGMEMGDSREPYDTLAMRANGLSEVFSHHR
jgi:hypothetical protein